MSYEIRRAGPLFVGAKNWMLVREASDFSEASLVAEFCEESLAEWYPEFVNFSDFESLRFEVDLDGGYPGAGYYPVIAAIRAGWIGNWKPRPSFLGDDGRTHLRTVKSY